MSSRSTTKAARRPAGSVVGHFSAEIDVQLASLIRNPSGITSPV
jgi:hypothetical protein